MKNDADSARAAAHAAANNFRAMCEEELSIVGCPENMKPQGCIGKHGCAAVVNRSGVEDDFSCTGCGFSIWRLLFTEEQAQYARLRARLDTAMASLDALSERTAQPRPGHQPGPGESDPSVAALRFNLPAAIARFGGASIVLPMSLHTALTLGSLLPHLIAVPGLSGFSTASLGTVFRALRKSVVRLHPSFGTVLDVAESQASIRIERDRSQHH